MTEGPDLQNIPDHILYKITKHLEPFSQRSLYLCSSKLYCKWHLSMPDDNPHWQFLNAALELIEAITLQGSVLYGGIYVNAQAAARGVITCALRGQNVLYDLYHGTVKDFSGLSKGEVWHRLAAVPPLSSAYINLQSCLDEGSPKLHNMFAKQCFELLCTSAGFMQFQTLVTDVSDVSSVHVPLDVSDDETIDGSHTVLLIHRIDKHGKSCWEMDGEECLVDPPQLNFDSMPEGVKMIRANLESGDLLMQHSLPLKQRLNLFLESQVVSDFFYKGNVDIEAWIELQHGAANDWYDHMDDLMEGHDGFDNMDDMDDADMAQLVGAMQD